MSWINFVHTVNVGNIWVKVLPINANYIRGKLMQCTVVDRVYKKKRSAEDTITNITLGSALKSWFE